MNARGIDISKYQRTESLPFPAWRALGYCYCYINVAIGILPDFRARANREAALAAGMLTGPYQALHERYDPREQARLLVSLRDPRDRLPDLADIERAGLSEAWARAFCDEHDKITDLELWIYTGPGAWAGIVTANHERYRVYGLFVADYGYVDLATDIRSDPPPNVPGRRPLPRIPAPWDGNARPYEMWQFAGDNGRLPGYESGIDLSEYDGTEEELFTRFATTVETPMPHAKLGPHHMLGGADTRRWLEGARPTVAKFADDFGPSVEALPGTLCVGRVVDDRLPGGVNVDINRLEQTHPPMAAAALYVEMLSERIRLNPRIDVWEGPNEPIIRSADIMAWYGAFLHEFARLIALKGRRAGLGGWSVGHPLREDELWPHYVRALQACWDYNAVLTRHEYGPMDGFLSLRYRWDNAEFTRLGYPNLPVIISECGADNVPGSGPWRQFYGGDIGRYWNELLLPYTRAIELDSFVIGATVFTSGGGGGNGWADFDVTGSGLVDRVIEYARTPRPTPVPVPNKEPEMIHITIPNMADDVERRVTEHLDALAADLRGRGDVHPYGPSTEPAPWWQTWPEGVISPPRKLAAPGKEIEFLNLNGQPFAPPVKRFVTWQMDATERRGDLLRVLDREGTERDWYCRVVDVLPA